MSKPTPTMTPATATINLHSSIAISNTSVPTVWNTLIDTSTWPQWNRFVPRVTIREQPSSSPSTEAAHPQGISPFLRLGTKMTFHANMDGAGHATPLSDAKDLREAHLVVSVFEPPTEGKPFGRIVWATDTAAPGAFAGWLLYAERAHEISSQDDDDDESNVRVENWELQKGLLTHIVKGIFGKRLQGLFQVWVDDLKAFVEKR
jgi:hypothetical protein